MSGGWAHGGLVVRRGATGVRVVIGLVAGQGTTGGRSRVSNGDELTGDQLVTGYLVSGVW